MADDNDSICCGGIIVIAVYLAVIYLIFAYLFVPALCVATIIMIVYILYNFSKAFSTGIKQENPDDPSQNAQPAYKQYFFRKAFADLKEITRENYALNIESLKGLWHKIKAAFFKGTQAWVAWPIGLAAILAIPVAIIVGGAVYLVVTLLHILTVLGVATGVLVLAGTLRTVESFNMARQRIFFACPNCYHKFPIPIYQCPNCDSEHTKLIPGQFGLLKRKCQCGTLLPTTFFNGRNKLPSKCPECHSPLTSDVGVAINVHYPIVGGAASGKSSFLVASMLELEKMGESNQYSLSFPEKADEMSFLKAKRDFEKGARLLKTATDKPKAFLAKIQSDNTRRASHLLYLYDAAGEAFEKLDRLRPHAYFEYISGIFFIVDPFSIPAVRQEYGDLVESHLDRVNPSGEQPQFVFDRMFNHLEQQEMLKDWKGRFKIPIAVIITKADAFNIHESIMQTELEQPDKDPDTIASDKVRQWLLKCGQGNFVRVVENSFTHVKYFTCSPLGRLPDEESTTSFIPMGMDEPIKWLFSARRILQ